MKESLEYYNQFDKKLINDYVLGNKRIINAIENLGSFIPENSNNILDIGSGLGWSSHEFAKAFPNSQVLAVDLSPVLINTASKLFDTQENLTFKSYDLTQGLPVDMYDAIVMIDVYEHIPIADRAKFHKSIKSVLAKNGRFILACPSKYHQDHLKNNNPTGLQPVDEDVDFGTIQMIAKQISGEVIYFEYQNIWNNYDYLYAVIELNPLYGNNVNGLKHQPIDIEQRKERADRVNSKLGIKVEQVKRKKKTTTLKSLLKRVKKK
ncbi:class I SAM-dependent methyltransferase [Winogradskyella immobilis]|uniref:Class I SAM-dependent methyltransferase n=1 Tax=Winogradskyella immobilis TaxID=2816852 RepID=A0ABS8ENW8_9FLAO|nr:class I SAM-dependent methyltransferase [Winogradskyella immobilis]MCC1484913.1 class I SAM-dependent methyltransferase [Winogradskyella immobilis]MCG0017005.1 class I SAM-dependent methyltransferase [Winogradskyella immobilis]